MIRSNIIWCERDRSSAYYRTSRYCEKNGKFTADHPAAPDSDTRMDDHCQIGKSPALEKFRALGYEASCFPEGDGISLTPPEGKTKEQAAQDVRDCFGFEV